LVIEVMDFQALDLGLLRLGDFPGEEVEYLLAAVRLAA